MPRLGIFIGMMASHALCPQTDTLSVMSSHTGAIKEYGVTCSKGVTLWSGVVREVDNMVPYDSI